MVDATLDERLIELVLDELREREFPYACFLRIADDPDDGVPRVEVHALNVLDAGRRAANRFLIEILLGMNDRGTAFDFVTFAHDDVWSERVRATIPRDHAGSYAPRS